MDIASYLNLLQLGAYAAFMAAVFGLVACVLLAVTVVMVADIRRRLVVGAVVEPPDPPPVLDFPAWVNPSEKRPAA